MFGSRDVARPQPQKLLSNISADRLDTNEEARVVPWLAGTQRLAVTWISPAYDPIADPITTEYQTGKNSYDTATVGYIYSAQLAGLICGGMAISLDAIYADGVKIWEGPAEYMGTAFLPLTTEAYGTMRIYWGSDNQPVDAFLAQHDHPAYRGICYVVCDRLMFGQDRTNAPNIEFVFSRPTRIPDWENPWMSGDVCPVHAAVELLCNPRFGLGLPLSAFDKESALAFSKQLEELDVGCSPVLTEAMTIPALLEDLFGYIDGYIFQRNGRYAFGSLALPPDYENAPTFDIDELTDEPEIETDSYAAAINETRLVYTNREREWKESMEPYFDSGSFAINGQSQPLVLQRRWITREGVANVIVSIAGRKAALPVTKGRIKVLLSAARNRDGSLLAPGDPFMLRPYHGANFMLACRVLEIGQSSAVSQEVDISWEADTSSALSGAVPGEFGYEKPVKYAPDLAPFERLFVLPESFPVMENVSFEWEEPPAGRWITWLGSRAHALITGSRLYRAQEIGGTYEETSTAKRLAATGTLTLPVTAGATGATLAMEPVDRVNIESASTQEADENRILMFIGAEIISVETYSPAPNNGVVLTNMRRGRFGTTAAAHPAGSRAFIIRRKDLPMIGPVDDPAAWWIKSRSMTIYGLQDISTSPALNAAAGWILAEDESVFVTEDGLKLTLE